MEQEFECMGTKIVLAVRRTRNEFAREKGHEVLGDEDVEGYRVTYEDGYVSWSPRGAFEKAYRKSGELTFGMAVEYMKLGKKASRNSWEEGKFITLDTLSVTDNDIIANDWFVKENEGVGTL